MAAKHDLRIEQGADLNTLFTWFTSDGVTPRDLTGYTAKLQVRPTAGGAVILTADSTAGTITLGGAQGTIQLAVPAATTAALTGWSSAVYDLLLTAPGPGAVTRLVEGKAIWAPRVTV